MAGVQGPYLVAGERSGFVLIYEGYRYQKNKVIHGRKIHWRCSDPGCRSPLQTNDFNQGNRPIVILNPGIYPDHTHPPEGGRLTRATFVTDCKALIQRDPSLPVRRAYEDTFRQMAQNQRFQAPMFEEIQSQLKRHRQSFLPPIPVNLNNVNIQGTWAETWGGQRKLLTLNNNLGVVVFASRRELEILYQCDVIYMDGTFRSAPAPYTQIFTIHGKYHGWVMPLVMCFLSGKEERQYRCVLQSIKAEITNITGQPFTPQEVVTDFEIGILNAVRQDLPQATLNGCYFHFTQSLMRRLNVLGLRRAYMQDPIVEKVVRRLMALDIPLPHVRLCFMYVPSIISVFF